MCILEHIPEQSNALKDSRRWIHSWIAGAFSLSVMLLAVGCRQEATAPQHNPIAVQVVPGSSQSGAVVAQFHDHFTGSVPADLAQICGIPSNVAFVVTDNFFLYADESFKDASSVMVTYTNPLNGKSVIVSSAGQISGRAIVDEVARTITFTTSYKGLPEKLKTANGPVLLRDAGIIRFSDKFNLDTFELISSEILVNKGPHPEADSDFRRFCEVVLPALT